MSRGLDQVSEAEMQRAMDALIRGTPKARLAESTLEELTAAFNWLASMGLDRFLINEIEAGRAGLRFEGDALIWVGENEYVPDGSMTIEVWRKEAA